MSPPFSSADRWPAVQCPGDPVPKVLAARPLDALQALPGLASSVAFPATLTKRSPSPRIRTLVCLPHSPQHRLASVLLTCLCPIHLVAVPGVGGQGRPVPGTQQTPHKCCRSGQTTARLYASCSPGHVTGAAPQTQQPPADRGGQRVTSSPLPSSSSGPRVHLPLPAQEGKDCSRTTQQSLGGPHTLCQA